MQPTDTHPTPPAPVADKSFLHTFTPGATLPLTQTVITAAIVFVAAYIIAEFGFMAVDSFRWALVIAAVFLAGTWLLILRRWLDLTALERALNLDLNGDGYIGEAAPAPEPPVLRVHFSKDDGGNYQANMFDLHVYPEKFSKLAKGILVDGLPFSERTWAGSGKLFSSEEWRVLKDEMLNREYIEQKSDKSAKLGYRLTEEGRAVMQEAMPESEVIE